MLPLSKIRASLIFQTGEKTDPEFKSLALNLTNEPKYETSSTWLQALFLSWHHPTKLVVRITVTSIRKAKTTLENVLQDAAF